MPDVFISYKAEDRKRVQPLVQALQADGYSVWWDEHIGTGDEWRQTIEKQLDSARCVVVVWTKGSVGPDGHFVRDEASRAQRRHVYVPVILDAVAPPLGFGESQATSLKGWKGDRSDHRYQAVLAAVQRIAGSGTGAAGAAAPVRTPVSRRAVLAGSGVAVVAIGGIGAWELLRPSAASASGSVAVLPFENLSGDPAQAYFADGVAEEIRSALERLGGLTVIGRTSSEAVRNDDAPTAARKLGVASILTGSVRQSPSTIRISAELVDGRTGADRWSQDYDRSPGDSIKIQTDIAQNVASALSAALGGAVRQAIALGGTQNPAAQDLLLQTDPEHSDQSADGLKSAITKLDEAIRLDPNYSQAYARKAHMLAFYGAVYGSGPDEGRSTIAEAERQAEKAIAIAPKLSEAHSALAFVYRQQLRFRESLKEAQIAVSLPGANSGAKGNYAISLAQAGYRDEPLRVAREAATIDPLNPVAFGNEAIILLSLHQFDAAAAAARHALELNSAQAYSRAVLAYCLTLMHRFPEARAEAAKLAPDDVHRLYVEAIIASLTGDNSASDDVVNQLRARYGDAASYQFAGIYAQRRDADRAIAALRKAVEVRDPGLATIQVDAFLDPIRGDPRLKDLIRSLDFPA